MAKHKVPIIVDILVKNINYKYYTLSKEKK